MHTGSDKRGHGVGYADFGPRRITGAGAGAAAVGRNGRHLSRHLNGTIAFFADSLPISVHLWLINMVKITINYK